MFFFFVEQTQILRLMSMNDVNKLTFRKEVNKQKTRMITAPYQINQIQENSNKSMLWIYNIMNKVMFIGMIIRTNTNTHNWVSRSKANKSDVRFNRQIIFFCTIRKTVCIIRSSISSEFSARITSNLLKIKWNVDFNFF